MTLVCLLFWHRWRIQAARGMRIVLKAEDEVPLYRQTCVLYRCTRCSRVRTKTIEGSWTLEQLVLGEERVENVGSKTTARETR